MLIETFYPGMGDNVFIIECPIRAASRVRRLQRLNFSLTYNLILVSSGNFKV